MRILIAGGAGAREHALAWKIRQSPLKPEIFHWPAHPCGEWMGQAFDLPPQASYGEVAAYAVKQKIDLVVVGPEVPLAKGLGDELRAKGLAVFGPNQSGAQLESSKAFAKQLMADAQIPTAAFTLTTGQNETLKTARQWLHERGGVVLKASGLAAGKGVFVCQSESQLQEAAAHLFGPEMAKASETVVLEELMTGRESSFFVFLNTAAKDKPYGLIGSAVDYKRLKAGNSGPNTGGMGGYAPVPWLDSSADEKILGAVIEPLVKTLQQRNIVYQGCIYVGLMWTAFGPKVVEFNCRFGDPEAEILALADQRDWLPLLAGAAGVMGFALSETKPRAMRPTVAIVLAAHDYPFGECSAEAAAVAAQVGLLHENIFVSESDADIAVFGAGIKREKSQRGFNYGKGRMLVVSAGDESFALAQAKAKAKIKEIVQTWSAAQWRDDIASEVVS